MTLPSGSSSRTLLLRAVALTLGGGTMAYFSPLDPPSSSIGRKRPLPKTHDTPLARIEEAFLHHLPTEVQRLMDGSSGDESRFMLLSCRDTYFLQLLRQQIRKRQGLTTYKVTLPSPSSSSNGDGGGGAGGGDGGGGLEVEVDVLAPPTLRDGPGVVLQWLPWRPFVPLTADRRVVRLASIDEDSEKVKGGDGDGALRHRQHVFIHLPPLPLPPLTAGADGAAMDVVTGLQELLSWIEGRGTGEGSYQVVTITSPSPLIFTRLQEALLQMLSEPAPSEGEEAEERRGEKKGSKGRGNWLDSPAVLVHVEGASPELVDLLLARKEEEKASSSPPASSSQLPSAALPSSPSSSSSETVEEEEGEASTGAAGKVGVCAEGEHRHLVGELLMSGAFERAAELMALISGGGVPSEEAMLAMVQQERARLSRLLALPTMTTESKEVEERPPLGGGFGGVDPVSAWDALCAVQAEKLDVMTGTALLPAGLAPLPTVLSACLDREADVHHMLDSGILTLHLPPPPPQDESISQGVTEGVGGEEGAPEQGEGEEGSHETVLRALSRPHVRCRVFHSPSLRDLFLLPLPSSSRPPSSPPSLLLLPPAPWMLRGDEVVSMPHLTQRASIGLTEDPVTNTILHARSDLRHVKMQQALLDTERAGLAHEWRALGDARAALTVRRSDLTDTDAVTLQLELISREQSASSRALEMRLRQARLHAMRRDIRKAVAAIQEHQHDDPLLTISPEEEEEGQAGGGALVIPAEEFVLWEMDHGHRGRPVEVPNEEEQEQKRGRRGGESKQRPQSSSGSWLQRFFGGGRGWWLLR